METLVNRKGQVTIPIELRRKHGIVGGSELIVEDTPVGIVLKVVPRIEDLAGVDAGKLKVEQALRLIENVRLEDRY